MAQAARKITRPRPASAAVPMQLYEEARRRLLSNEPMLGEARSGAAAAAAAALTVGEVDALESAGLSTAPWVASREHDPLIRTIADYMALLETSLTTAEA